MQHALALAVHAETEGEVPVGAVIVRDDCGDCRRLEPAGDES